MDDEIRNDKLERETSLLFLSILVLSIEFVLLFIYSFALSIVIMRWRMF